MDQNERVQAGSTTYVTSALDVSSATTGSTTSYYTRDNNGNLVSLRTGTSSYYYLFDGMGSVIGLVDTTGTKVNSYSYDPYGEQLTATEGISNPWRYAAGQFDTATGLTKFGVRYYNAAEGRFTQRDPSHKDLDYAYAEDNPINRTDPTGLCGFDSFSDFGDCVDSVVGDTQHVVNGIISGVVGAIVLGACAAPTAGETAGGSIPFCTGVSIFATIATDNFLQRIEYTPPAG
jgi:RHS repeat-associated protein